jgi:hypothetical protein
MQLSAHATNVITAFWFSLGWMMLITHFCKWFEPRAELVYEIFDFTLWSLCLVLHYTGFMIVFANNTIWIPWFCAIVSFFVMIEKSVKCTQ